MKSSDVSPLTTIYQQRRGEYGPSGRAVVLATGTWGLVNADGSHYIGFNTVATTFAPVRGPIPHYMSKGWLVLVHSSFTRRAEAPTDEELLAHAARAWAAIQAGGLPTDLPEGVGVTALAAREIIQTWDEHSAEQARRQVAATAAAERKAADEQAQAQAMDRITAVLGTEVVERARIDLRLNGKWVQMEQLLTAYHQAQSQAGTGD